MIRMYKPRNVYACDFETTVYEGQDHTEVWSAAFAKLNTEQVRVCRNIREFWYTFVKMRHNVLLYFHNLKFDGSFLLDFWIWEMKYKEAVAPDGKFLQTKEMEDGTYSLTISDFGLWYCMRCKVNDHVIEIRDSYKLMPFSLKEIGKAFQTKHRKSDMEYVGYRYAGCRITPEEMEYIKNDIYVLKEALEFMYKEGHDRLTIASCCYAEYQRKFGEDWDTFFPNVYQMELPEEIYGSPNAGEYIRKAYRGGWCYVVSEKAGKVFRAGSTYDVNSLYPSMMHSESGNYYPIGKPTFFRGEIPRVCYESRTICPKFFYVRFKCRFRIRPGYLPWVQIKRNWLYRPNQCLTTSDVWNSTAKKYVRYYVDIDGIRREAKPTLTMTCVDFQLFQEHYQLYDLEILDGCWFNTEIGLFDTYINKYRQMKITSTGAMRTLAKLYLNSLYGRFATTPDNSFKRAYLDEFDETIHYTSVSSDDQTPGYIPIGAAITSYAKNFTIRAAQKNFYGGKKHGFIYADTDSIHLDIPPSRVQGIKIDDSAFCCWKRESIWTQGIFVRAKTYVEKVNGRHMVKCAGLSEHGKNMVSCAMGDPDNDVFDEEEYKWIQEHKMTISGFKHELTIPNGKLTPKRMRGGIVLETSAFTIK